MAISKNPYSLYFPIKLGCLNIFIYIDENLYATDGECCSHPHSHHTYELRYVEQGCCTQVVNGEPQKIREKELLLVRPGEYHYQSPSNSGGSSQYSLRFRIEGLSQSAPAYQQQAQKAFLGILQTARTVHDAENAFPFLFRSLKNEILEKNTGYIYNLQLLSTLILTEFIRYTDRNIDSIFPPEDIKYRGLLMTKMEQFFSWKYMNDVKIKDLAEDVMVSERHAARILHQIYGMSFSRKLTEVRLQHAAYQLENTDLKTEEISKACGFNNSSYFYMSFRKQYNMTPSEFRQKHTSEQNPMRADLLNNTVKESYDHTE